VQAKGYNFLTFFNKFHFETCKNQTTFHFLHRFPLEIFKKQTFFQILLEGEKGKQLLQCSKHFFKFFLSFLQQNY